MRHSILLKKIGIRIRMRRSYLGITQIKLAELAECSLQAIGNIERGVANPSILMIYKISCALNVSIKELLP